MSPRTLAMSGWCRTGIALVVSSAWIAGSAFGQVAFHAEAKLPDDAVAQAEEGLPAETAVQAEDSDAGGTADQGTSASGSPKRRPGEGVEEITITARKREEGLQDAPLSVSAFSSATLDELTTSRIDDIGKFVPNLQIGTGGGGSNSTRIQIRGVGNADPIVSRDPAVGIYIDGVYLSRAQGSLLQVADLERVEVLRGPQGTLYGRNTIGGAINLVTKKPDEEYGADLSVRVGNYNLLETKTSVNIPLLPEKLMSRISFVTQTREGYTHNLLDGERTDDNKLLTSRAALRYLASDNVILDFAGDISKRHQNGRGGQCRYDDNQPAAVGVLRNGVGFASLPPLQNQNNGFRDRCRNSTNLDEFDYRSDINSELDEDTLGLASTLTWDLEDTDMTVKWINAWRRQETSGESEFDFTETRFGRLRDPSGDQSDQISSEFNLSGLGFDGKFKWTTGLYGSREKSNSGKAVASVAADLSDYSFAQAAGLPAGIGTSGTPFLNFLGFNDALDIASFSEQNDIANNNFAAYGQATYDFTERISLTAGLRRLVERKQIKTKRFSAVGDPFAPMPGQLQTGVGNDARLNGDTCFKAFQPGCANIVPLTPVGPDGLNNDMATLFPGVVEGRFQSTDDTPLQVDTSERFDAWTGLVNLQYRLNDDAMIYGSFSNGYKSGGFNGRLNPQEPSTQENFDPEKLDSYELGLKSAWFDNRLVANIALFYSQYDDIQQTILKSASDGSFASVVRNAGEAVVRGAEVELRGAPLAGLDMGLNLGFTDADYRENLREIREKAPGPDGILDNFVCGSGVFPDPAACAGDPTDPNSQVRVDRRTGSLNLVSTDDTTQMVNFRREEFFNVPNFTASAYMAYTFDTPVGSLTPRVSWFHQNAIQYSVDPNGNGDQDKYGLLSGRVGLLLADGVTEVAIFGSNLLDRRYINDAISFDDGFAVTDVYYGPPRMYGLEVRRTFTGF